MYQNFLERALSAQENFIIFGDKVYWIGEPIEQGQARDSLVQKIREGEIHFALSHGTPVSDLEASDTASNSKEIAEIKSRYIEDNLRAEHSAEITKQLELANKYKVMRFVVDEVFPRLTAAPLEERIQAGLSGDGRKVQTGEEIVREILGDKIRSEKRVIELGAYSLERVRKDLEQNMAAAGQERNLMQAYGAAIRHLEGTLGERVIGCGNPLSLLFSKITGSLPLMHLGGQLFYFDNPGNSSSLALNIDGLRLGVNSSPLDKRDLLERYKTFSTLRIKEEAADELEKKLQEIKGVITTNIDYMALMDQDEFRFRDLVFYRNGDVYYVGFRLPKFARQTTFDENLFIPKEFDEEGFAGDLCIGLEVQGGQISYQGNNFSAGVTYRGPIKKDAPFQGRVQIVDPVMRERYGELIIICHVGGYPQFEMSPDGFIQFLFYARDNFLNSHRQDFLFDHHDQQERAKLLDAGKIITKQKAEELRYLLVNIHHVTEDAKTRGREARAARMIPF